MAQVSTLSSPTTNTSAGAGTMYEPKTRRMHHEQKGQNNTQLWDMVS